MNNKENYKDAAIHALAGFQLIETSLKLYIGEYYKIARKLLHNKLHFEYKESDISEAALQKLLGIFAKINSNKELIEKLRSLIKQRDKLAHKAFVELYGKAQLDKEFGKMSEEYIRIAEDLGEILGAINHEILKLYIVVNSKTK